VTLPKTILIVDDQPENLELFRYLLSRSGHRVVTAIGGKEGLARAQELRPDLVIIDLHMPDIDGWDLAHRIRQDESLAGARLLAVSVGPASNARAREAGFDGFFPMPFEPADFTGVVATLLDPGPAR
jgi:CheY-like chemotaxis protein